MIHENIVEVEKRIRQAAIRGKRNLEDITLIAVSKTKPVFMIEEAYACGCRDFGENKVQELCDKYDKMPKDIRWHMIGHLQKNKVKYIVNKVCMIHSVDSLELARTIQKEALKHDTHMNILIEVNIADEESKFGVGVSGVFDLLYEIAKLDRVHVMGLMTVAPMTEKAESNRIYFQKLHDLFIDIKRKNIDNVNMSILSMGMTGDYEIAIEEGATFVRVGTGVFGERCYSKN